MILESATRLFSEKGFGEATVSAIAKGSGITPSSLYTYFKS
jgi:TetR/AcrR family fatty acid metabolism transcriptional regulator